MNVNSKPPAPAKIDVWVANATTQLDAAKLSSARLDAELLISYSLDKERSWVIAHGGDLLDSRVSQFADTLLQKRLSHVPLAYLFGTKEFYRREFLVTKDVLVPRPESETLINQLLELDLPRPAVIHDVGTGSGCLAITAKLELPHATVTGSDVSVEALEVARKNASHLKADVSFRTDHLMDSYYPPGSVSVILANLPYVDETWERSRSTDHEPPLALFADDDGLALIKQLIVQAPSRLAHAGYLLLEADPVQHDKIVETAASHGLGHVETKDYIVVLQKL